MARSRHRSHASHAIEKGQATLELAVSLPLFLLLILGAVEIASIASSALQVNNAARAGAALGSMSRANSVDSADIETAAQNEAPSLTNLQVASSQVCYCVTDGVPAALTCNTSALSNCPSPGVIQVAVQVETSAVVKPLIHFSGLPVSYTLHGRATMDVLQ